MEKIGKYVIHRVAATTGYARILFCHDPDLMVPVAIKLFDPRRVADWPLSPPQLLSRFMAEARALASFDHPAIIAVKSLDHLDDGRPFYVMPYLASHLPYEIGSDDDAEAEEGKRPGRRVSTARALVILRHLALALAALHRRGMVHRWVKPSNILLTAREDGAVKLADFSRIRLPQTALPLPDHWLGDASYCAPEQLENAGGVGPQADVYAVGMLAYRLVVGRRPDGAGGPVALPDDQPETLIEMVRLATDPDPSRRPAHGGALLTYLDRAVPRRSAPAVEVVTTRRAPAASGRA
jgi:serine/threonine-protein kinase